MSEAISSLSCNYFVERDNAQELVLRDVGPWETYMTITNDILAVVALLAPELRGRRLLYYDSEGELTLVLVEDGRFAGFRIAEEEEEE